MIRLTILSLVAIGITYLLCQTAIYLDSDAPIMGVFAIPGIILIIINFSKSKSNASNH